ncbi:hypothetical protein [Klebsiella aerogenes]|uniref:hypothetical protein n=1 Tax=Klebsiella aerogenes TaxID=548 RepID=UPI001F23FB07|nr:hypothetical protein [Klebsiella aerogenes]
MRIVIVGHHARRGQAEALARSLDAHLLTDEGNHGANWNHQRAIAWAAEQSERVIVMEDDAMPVTGFSELAQVWLDRFPEHLLSFYLGTGRPPQYQQQIAQKLIDADKHHADHITLPRLIHGVCYSVPPAHLPVVLKRWESNKAADYAVGDAWGGIVIYPCWSLVDHRDGLSVERPWNNALRRERRVAWRLHSGAANDNDSHQIEA